MICNQTTGCNCLRCRPTQQLIYRPEFITPKESEFVKVKKEDLEFIFSQLGKLDEYQNYEKQKEFKSKYLGEKGK